MTRYLPALDQVLPPLTALRYTPDTGLIATDRVGTPVDDAPARAWFEELQLSLPNFRILDLEAAPNGGAALDDAPLDMYRLARAATVIRSQALGHPRLWLRGARSIRIAVAIHITPDDGGVSLAAETGSELHGDLVDDTTAAETALGTVTITAANLLLGAFGRHIDWLQSSGLRRLTVELNAVRPSETQTRIAMRYLQRVLRPARAAA